MKNCRTAGTAWGCLYMVATWKTTPRLSDVFFLGGSVQRKVAPARWTTPYFVSLVVLTRNPCHPNSLTHPEIWLKYSTCRCRCQVRLHSLNTCNGTWYNTLLRSEIIQICISVLKLHFVLVVYFCGDALRIKATPSASCLNMKHIFNIHNPSSATSGCALGCMTLIQCIVLVQCVSDDVATHWCKLDTYFVSTHHF